jgi:spore germination protein KA
MSGFFSKRGRSSPDFAPAQAGATCRRQTEIPVSRSLEDNIRILKELFEDVDMLQIRQFQSRHLRAQQYCIAYCDGVVDPSIINENIIKPAMLSDWRGSAQDLIDGLAARVISVNRAEKVGEYQKIIEAVTYGDTVFFAQGADQALILATKGFVLRGITEPDSEKNLSGPREGFGESLLLNLSMIRRKMRSNELKIKYYTFGQRTKTKAAVCYIEGIANKEILQELYRRLDTIDIDGVLDTNYINELIKDSPLSPFASMGYTERPDVVMGKLLEGRIALVVDGTPNVLTVPYLFIENFQSSEDYYMSFFYTSFTRLLRILSFFITVTLPGFYVAMAGFHHELMPTPFLLNIASERNSVPFPAAMEAFLMLLVFDILRETGARMPSTIGQALSIVGALVIGQAAVEAKIVASPMIIVVAMAGITNLVVPKLNAAITYARVFVLILSTMFGFTGTNMGISVIIIHVLSLHSLGIPQISAKGGIRFQQVKDTFIRAPWWLMKMRIRHFAINKTRMRTHGKDNGG